MGLCFHLSEHICVFPGGQEVFPLVRKQGARPCGVGWGVCRLTPRPAPTRHSSCLQLCRTGSSLAGPPCPGLWFQPTESADAQIPSSFSGTAWL